MTTPPRLLLHNAILLDPDRATLTPLARNLRSHRCGGRGRPAVPPEGNNRMAPRKPTGKPTGKSIVSNLGKRLSSLAARVPVLSRPARGTRARPDAKTRSRSTSSASPVIDVRKAVRSALAPLPSVVTAPFKRAAKASATKPSATRTTSRKTAAHAAGRPQGKRERIDPTPGKTGGSRYVRRDSAGHFTKDQVAVGRSLAADRRSKAKTKATKGNKDRGD